MVFSPPCFCDECGAANTSQATHCFACRQLLNPAPPPLVTRGPIGRTAHAPFPSALSLLPGTLLAQRYTIIDQIGQGGYGVVYKANDSHQRHKLVAIKQINLRALSIAQIIEATDTYNREVTLLSRLDHPNLPRIYDHFTDPEHWYLVMDYIEGGTLEDHLKQTGSGSGCVKEVLTIGITLCSVLSYLHTRRPPIIFRDIKPANIMRTPRGHLYLIDFGIARRFRPGQAKDTGPLGSPGYAAPEQYGKTQTSVQTDIYGLGATLQALLIGSEPSALGKTPPIAHHRIPKPLQQLLQQMLEWDAGNRPKDMDEVKQRLQRIKDGVVGPIARHTRAFFLGLLFGSLPYSLIFPLVAASNSPLGAYLTSLESGLASVLAMSLFCSWPLFFLGQVVAGIQYLLVPGKRVLGLGILSMLLGIHLGLLFAWLPSP